MGLVLEAVAQGAARRRWGADVVAARLHAERPHDLGFDIVLIGAARDVGDDPAEQGVTEIRIFELALGRSGERHSGAQHAGELGLRKHLLAIAPGVVGDKAADMAQEVADADAGAVGRRVAPAPHLGHIGFGECVQRQPPLVAQLQDRQCGERLGHGRDAKQSVGVDRPMRIEILLAIGADMDQPPVPDDAPDHAGDVRLSGESAEIVVDAGEQLIERARDRRGRRRLRQGRRGGGQKEGGDEGGAHVSS